MYFDHEKEVREGADPARAAAGMQTAPRDLEGHAGIRKHLLNLEDSFEDRGYTSSESSLEALSSAMSRAIRKRAIDGMLERALVREAHEADAAERQMRLCGIDVDIDDEAGVASGEKKTNPSESAPYMSPTSRVRLLAELAESSRDRLLRELAQCSRERLLRELQLDTSSQGARVPASSASSLGRDRVRVYRPGSNVTSQP